MESILFLIVGLLGDNIFWHLLCSNKIKFQNSQIIADKTKLVWTLSGLSHFSPYFRVNLYVIFVNLKKHNQLDRFWQIDHCDQNPRKNPEWSSEARDSRTKVG